MGTHLAEVWEFDGEPGESFDITGTAFSFKAVTDDQYRVTKEPRGNSYLGGATSSSWLETDIRKPMNFELDFDFPFYGTKYSSLCLSSQGHIVFPDTEGLFPGCELIDTETPITLETHYNAKRISFSFDHWVPACGDKNLGCMRAKKGVLEDGRQFFTVNMLNVPDVSNPAYDLNVAQVQVRILSDGEIQMYTRWSRSRDGIMGISPGYAPLNYEEVNFSGEFCKPRTTPLADGTCKTCGGKNQPICENSKSDKPCRNRFVEEVDDEGKKTGLCVRP
ncbi:Hypothetical Protein FCC1311_113632 [Hondaea fermentalgiana]|uniref:Uncharacterized protein n=1 Tax=Hondaea fermentalgiana TaxID=2315210 RepID=A0A2R5GWD3_9STRA|nr:Hypothetical Protein FCC1311_113632 [Hondaea fermentalgiana]|eukprot:GBG35140.1 Hypothetical Protein FCC1311_113632 [Hondaea fermentalgiana]